MKCFINDIASKIIEAKLISLLSNIFKFVTVFAISADLVMSMAEKSKENHAQCKQLTKQLNILIKDSDTYKCFISIKLFSKTCLYFVLIQWLLISWISADDNTTQFDFEFNNNSASNSFSNFNERFELLFKSDISPVISLRRLDS